MFRKLLVQAGRPQERLLYDLRRGRAGKSLFKLAGYNTCPLNHSLQSRLASTASSPTAHRDLVHGPVDDNVRDRAAKIEGMESLLRYTFQNKDLIWEAIQAPGRLNERLALVGDAVLRLETHRQSYLLGISKGAADKRHQAISTNRHLAEVGFGKDFSSFINKNISHVGNIEQTAMAATVEAVIGAAFLDGGLDAATTVLAALGLEQGSSLQDGN